MQALAILTTGLSNKADQSAFDVLEGVVATKSTPDGVDLKLSNYSTTAAMNGSIASANNTTLATVAANYGLKTVVDQHSLDIAARITPLEVVTAAALASELASQAGRPGRVGHAAGRRYEDSKCPPRPSSQRSDATLLASYATNAALSASETALQSPRRNPRGARRPSAFRRRSC